MAVVREYERKIPMKRRNKRRKRKSSTLPPQDRTGQDRTSNKYGGLLVQNHVKVINENRLHVSTNSPTKSFARLPTTMAMSSE